MIDTNSPRISFLDWSINIFTTFKSIDFGVKCENTTTTDPNCQVFFGLSNTNDTSQVCPNFGLKKSDSGCVVKALLQPILKSLLQNQKYFKV